MNPKFAANAAAITFDALFFDAKHFCYFPAWQHRFDERGDAQLHRRERGVAMCDLIEIVRIETAVRKLSLLPCEMTFSVKRARFR